MLRSLVKMHTRLLGVLLALTLTATACSGDDEAPFEDDVIVIDDREAVTPIIASSELVVGANRFVLGILGPDGRPIVDARVNLRFFDLNGATAVEKFAAATVSRVPARDAGIEEQIERMNDIVRYQLRKPATLATDGLGVTPIPVEDDLQRLVDGLTKVYTEKSPQITLEVTSGVRFRGDKGDFLELAGNLLDNACKWCKTRVDLTITPLNATETGSGDMRIVVSDDGPGIPKEAADELLKRGMRLDEATPGHGIGLAVVKDIAASYGGDISIGKSNLGGAEITVTVAPSVES